MVYQTTVLDALHTLSGPSLSANWKIFAVVLAISLAWSLVRRNRWSRQNTKVNTVATTIGFIPLDELPIERVELKSFDFLLGLGKRHNIIGGSVDGNEVVLFDTEVRHTRGEPSLQTIAAFKLTGSKLPNFNLQPKSVAGRVLSIFGKDIEFGDSAFSRDYFLTSAEEPVARACFTPEFRQFFEGLEQFDSAKNWHLQKRGDWVIVYRKDEGVESDELQTFLEGTAEIIRQLEGASGKAQPA
jgi:hypothetical protein